MRLALREAAAVGDGADVPVGAVVLDPGGSLLAVAGNTRERTGDPTAHAEVVALRLAAERLGTWRLAGCTLVVTLEPCPMCAGAVALARVDRLVFGAWNLQWGAVGSVWDVLRDPRAPVTPQVAAGVLEEECAAVLRSWFGSRRGGAGASTG
jgi:tRNA(adenine34) deaminase